MEHESEQLIDLNATIRRRKKANIYFPEAESAEESLLKRRAPTSEDRLNAFLVGAAIGFLVSLVIIIIYLHSTSDVRAREIIISIFVIAGPMTFIGGCINYGLFESACKESYLRVNTDSISYWTRNGEIWLSLGKVFGAGPEMGTFGEFLRICALFDDQSGFAFMTPSFRDFVAESGPAKAMSSEGEGGNKLARKVIIHYINERKKYGLPVAELRPYQFQSVRTHRNYLLGREEIINVFECDGKTLVFVNGEVRHEIPVHAVRRTIVTEASRGSDRTRYTVDLILDPSIGQSELLMDILQIPNSEEITRYCLCLPTLFPPPQL